MACIMVQAPAGFGKTSLLARWRREHLARRGGRRLGVGARGRRRAAVRAEPRGCGADGKRAPATAHGVLAHLVRNQPPNLRVVIAGVASID
ncbi:MAG TPA: hypothetical protein VLC47_07125 [Burkholderiales bacterium]|nr:hypothetical protein [Burkholderiales bacterium]